jgi:hypothetical protein
MDDNKYIRFDWAAKRMLRDIAKATGLGKEEIIGL